MDVKNIFLNCYISKEVYAKQPPSFKRHDFQNHVFKLKRAFYGSKESPRA